MQAKETKWTPMKALGKAQKEIEKALTVTDTAINGNIGGFLGYNDVVKQQVL